MDSSLKVILVGDGGVGKTSFVKMVREREICDKYFPTEGADVVEIRTSSEKKLQLWDCGGRHRGLKDGYWIGAKAGIVMFSVNSARSWDNVKEWIKSISAVCGDIPLIVVGAKVDLANIEVDKGMVARGLYSLRRKHPSLRYAECSPKIGYGCDEVVELVSGFFS